MRYKLLNSGAHSLVDYAFGLALATAPKIMNADAKTVRIYCGLAAQVLLYSALSKQPYAIKPVIPMLLHKKIDLLNLGTLGLLHFYKRINKKKRISAFNIGMIALGVGAVLLTNWKSESK